MNRMQAYVSVALDRLKDCPLWIYGVIGLLVAGVLYMPDNPASSPPPDLVQAVRAEIASVATSSQATTAAVETGTVELKSHTQLLTEIRDLLQQPRRRVGAADSETTAEYSDAESSVAAEPDDPASPASAPPAPAIPCITLPDGTQHDLLTLIGRSTGAYLVDGGRYRESLLGHGFLDSELPADQGQCRLIYDAWKSSQAPRLQSASQYSPPPQAASWQTSRQAPQWRCSGGRCYRVGQ